MKKLQQILILVLVLFGSGNLNAQCWDTLHVSARQNAKIGEGLHSPLTAFADGSAYYMDNYSSEFYKSTNYGTTWKLISRISKAYSTKDEWIKFIDIKKGWAIFNDSLYTTNDGGLKWVFQYDFLGETIAPAMFFFNDKIGWLRIKNQLQRTKDGGYTWEKINEIQGFYIFTLSKEAGKVYNNGVNRNKVISIDTGKTWQNVPFLTYKNQEWMKYITANKIVAVTHDTTNPISGKEEGHGIFYSDDGGNKWRRDTIFNFHKDIYNTYGGLSIFFADSLNGVMYNSNPIEIEIYRTKDGGISWRKDKLPKVPYYQETDWEWKMAYPSKDFGLISYREGTMLRYHTPPPPDCNLVVVVDSLQKDKPISWYPPAGCVGGYVLKIGTTNNGGEIVDSLDVGDTLQWLPNKALPYGKDIYVSIRPYNDGGFAPKCNAVIVPTKSCTLTTRIDTIIKIGTPIYNKIYTNDTLITKAYKSQQGCDSIVNIYVDVLTSNQDLPVEFIQSLTVAPNPTTGNLQVAFQLKSATSGKLYITDRLGRTLWQSETKEWSIGQQRLDLEVSQYPSGVYQLHWQSNHGRSVVRWIKVE